MPLPASEHDRPLHDDVRFLASSLGDIVRRFEGDEVFAAIEQLRVACRNRRRGDADAATLEQLLAEVEALPLERAVRVARAFVLFFVLINTAEQVHRVRLWQAQRLQGEADDPQSVSAMSALKELKARGKTAGEVREALRTIEVRPVLTAHPTEATRRTTLQLQSRVASLLLEQDDAAPDDQLRLAESLRTEIELLWVADEVRRDRPSVIDEVSSVVWYLEHRLLSAVSHLDDVTQAAFRRVFDASLGFDLGVSLGSWVGGDRDGNPFVTPETTLAATRRTAHALLGYYRTRIDELIERLAVSDHIVPAPQELRRSLHRDRALLPEVWERNRRRDAHEPVRMKLSFAAARLEASQKWLAARDAGHPEHVPFAYRDSEELLSDLELVDAALEAARADHAREILLKPLLAQVRRCGFFGYRLDIREDAALHEAALRHIARQIGVELEGPALERELLGRRPLLSDNVPVDEATRRTVDVFRVMRSIQAELGERAACTYIVSMTQSAEDLLRVLVLAREAGLCDLVADPPRSSLDVVPLFETGDALERAVDIMRSLWSSPAYRRQLQARGGRQEVMLGYSDSAKDVGVLASSWLLYRTQERLADAAREANIELGLFHGRGGTVGRGGGSPVYRGLTALPPGAIGRLIKVTEQGEVISQKFGILSVAQRSLEVLVAGTLMARLVDFRTQVGTVALARYEAAMEELAELSRRCYRRFVHEDDRLFEMFQKTTPVSELANVHFGSRPAYRERASGTIEGIRAIPWNFGWTQTRFIVPGWLGVGTALSALLERPGGGELLCEMAEHWPFFDDLLGKLEMVCEKADMEMARLYVQQLGGDLALFEELEAEYVRTREALLAIRQEPRLLANQEFLASELELRDPYVDVLNLLELSSLKRKRHLRDDGGEASVLAQLLGSALNGVAHGMRNTG